LERKKTIHIRKLKKPQGRSAKEIEIREKKEDEPGLKTWLGERILPQIALFILLYFFLVGVLDFSFLFSLGFVGFLIAINKEEDQERKMEKLGLNIGGPRK